MNTLHPAAVLIELIGALQVAVLASTLESPHETLERFAGIAARIPSNLSRPELAILTSLLVVHTARWTLTVLPREHGLVLSAFSRMLSADSASLRDTYCGVLDTIRCALGDPAVRSPEGRAEPRVAAALVFMRLNCFNRGLRLDDVARAVNVSRSHLEHLMKRHTGCPFKVHVRTARVRAACLLLESTTLAVKEVADHVGYPHGSELTRDFRLALNTNPREWRRSRQNEGRLTGSTVQAPRPPSVRSGHGGGARTASGPLSKSVRR